MGLTPDQQRRRRVADELAEFGMVESLSYPFVGDDDYKAFGFDPEATKKVSVEIANPLYGDRPYLRREILPTPPPPCSATSAAASKTCPCMSSATSTCGIERARHPGTARRRAPHRRTARRA